MYCSSLKSWEPISATHVLGSDVDYSCLKELRYTYILEINELETFCILKHNHSSTTFKNMVNLLHRTPTVLRTLKVQFNKIMGNVWKASDMDAFANRDLLDGNLCIIQTILLAFGLYFREIWRKQIIFSSNVCLTWSPLLESSWKEQHSLNYMYCSHTNWLHWSALFL